MRVHVYFQPAWLDFTGLMAVSANMSHNKIPLEEYIQHLREADSKVDGPLTKAEFREMPDTPTPRAVIKRFGTWNAAKEAAGLKTLHQGQHKWSPWNVGFYTGKQGYEIVAAKDTNCRSQFMHHRLIAVAEYGFESVCGMSVHHKNGVPWDNRLSNLELMDHAEHTSMHRRSDSPTTA